MRRREFLKLTAAAASLPVLWIPKSARAATPGSNAVKHLLVLYAKGGLRSHATFNAGVAFQHNPFGVQESALGTQWKLGAACSGADVETSLGTMPGFPKVTSDVAVIPCVDHTPGATLPDVDHRTGANRMATGSPDGTTGILSLIGKHHPMYARGFSLDAAPPVEIGTTEMGLGAGDYATTRPLSIFGATQSFAADLPIGKGWKIEARAALDARFRERRARPYRTRLSNFLLAKRNTAIFADMLKDPSLNILGLPDAVKGGVTNGQMIEALGNYSLTALGDMEDIPSWGPDVAMALRFFQFGSPVVVVTRETHDMHDNERINYGPRTTDLVRQLAGLDFLLKKMPHPVGGTFWDHTMVAVVSEFSRNNAMPETGFNSGNGSDHVVEDSAPQRNQAIAVMGGIVAARGKLLGATDENMHAVDRVYSSRSLLSTFLDVLGVDHRPFWGDEPIRELFV